MLFGKLILTFGTALGDSCEGRVRSPRRWAARKRILPLKILAPVLLPGPDLRYRITRITNMLKNSVRIPSASDPCPPDAIIVKINAYYFAVSGHSTPRVHRASLSPSAVAEIIKVAVCSPIRRGSIEPAFLNFHASRDKRTSFFATRRAPPIARYPE